jgi:YD repeat-containing protein
LVRELPVLGSNQRTNGGEIRLDQNRLQQPGINTQQLALILLVAGWILFGPSLARDHGRLSLGPANAHAEITYIYDRIGRLIGVVDPAGDTAVYHYDAVGNLTSISRQSSALVSVIDFNPTSGPVGAAVTIHGTGFSSTPSQNTVTFDGTAATVSSASPTALVVTVPAGATTGSIAVTAPAGSASSSMPFTVTATSGAPTITSFTPTIGTPGTAVSITGTNFELTPTHNRLRFNIVPAPITSSTTTNISVAVPGWGTSGRLSLATPGGTTQSTDDFFVPPPPNTAADVSFTGRAAIGGPTINASMASVGKIALIVFDGTAGQQVSVGISAGNPVETETRVFHPNGTQLGWVYSDFLGRDLHLESLPVTGTYTIRVAPLGFYTGTKPITLSQDLIVGSIVVGGASVPVNLTRPGQRARLTFAGTAGQRLNLGFLGASAFDAITVTKPDGSTFATFPGNTDLSIVMPPLPTTGTYGILVDPRYAETRSMTLTLSEEVSGSIVIDGSALPLTLARVGQVARVTLSATAGQRLNLAVTSATLSTSLSILKPDGTNWHTTSVSNGSVVDTAPAPTTGTYTIVLDPGATITGSLTLTLSAEIAAGITMGGPPVSVSVTRPGQKARLTFSGTATQRVSLNITGVTVSGTAYVGLLKPSGTPISGFPNWSQMNFFGPGSGFLGTYTLGTTETAYAVYLAPSGTGTAGATFTLYNVPPDVTGTLTINGTAAAVAITVPGQNSAFTFTGTAGQVVTLRGAGNTVGCGNFVVIFPNTSVSATPQCAATFATGATLQTGLHTLIFDPSGPKTGSVSLSVTLP